MIVLRGEHRVLFRWLYNFSSHENVHRTQMHGFGRRRPQVRDISLNYCFWPLFCNISKLFYTLFHKYKILWSKDVFSILVLSLTPLESGPLSSWSSVSLKIHWTGHCHSALPSAGCSTHHHQSNVLKQSDRHAMAGSRLPTPTLPSTNSPSQSHLPPRRVQNKILLMLFSHLKYP